MIELKHLDHLVIRAKDLEAMIGFYCTVVGCTIDKRVAELGLAHLRAGTSMIDVIAVDGKLGLMGGAPPDKEGRNLDHLCLRVENFSVENVLAHLQACGVEASEVYQNYGAEGYGASIYIKDPEGNTIELKGPADENG
ncbi:MAG: VOC family protein [Acidobacteria bacterium]|nr:VOC family protein [Acidobacteriota bacterium]